MTELSNKEIQEWTERINEMPHVEMARLWRFAIAGHPVFDKTLPLFDIFQKRFSQLGGMTPAISKEIGLG